MAEAVAECCGEWNSSWRAASLLQEAAWRAVHQQLATAELEQLVQELTLPWTWPSQ